MHSDATTVEAYLKQLPDERRKAIAAVRNVILENLPQGITEAMNWGMISYEVPLGTYPDTYNGKPLLYAALANQKNHMAVYLMGIYGSASLRDWFEEEYRKTRKRMDLGKSCVRFKRIEDLPIELIGQAIGTYELDGFLEMTESHSRKK